jgi:AcrR family transcriptional regulator
MKIRVSRPKPKTVRKRHSQKSARTRDVILRTAVGVASVRGLEGLSIGSLADELGMSKSGLFAHFGSKEELQLAAIQTARQIFIDEVFRPVLESERGLLRLWKLCDSWLSYAQRKVFPGGCFFTGAAFEFDSRSGPIRDRIAEVMREWLSALARAVEEAQAAGDLDAKIDARQLAFEIQSLAMGAIWASQLLDDNHAFSKAKTIIRDKLRSMTTGKAPALPGSGLRSR